MSKPNKVSSRSMMRSVKEGRQNHLHATTSTPKTHNWRGDYSSTSLTSLGLNNPELSPVSPSPPTVPEGRKERDGSRSDERLGHLGIPQEVLAFLQDENAFSPESVPPPITLKAESPVSISSQRSSRESLIGGTYSPVAGTVNPAFIDETDDIVSERGYTLAALRRMSPTARGKPVGTRPSRSPSPGDVFLPNAASTSLGQTSKSSSRGNSPSGKQIVAGRTRRQSSTDSVESTTKGARQKSRTSPLQALGHENIAMKILKDTMKHMTAVERMQQYSDLQHNREKLRRNSSQDRVSPMEQETKFNSTSSSNNNNSATTSNKSAAQVNNPVSATVVESKIQHHTANAESMGAPNTSLVGRLEKAGKKPPPPIKARPLFDNKPRSGPGNNPTPHSKPNGVIPSRTNGFSPQGTNPSNGMPRTSLGPIPYRTNHSHFRESRTSDSSDKSSDYPRSPISSEPDNTRHTPPYNSYSIHNKSTLPLTKPISYSSPPDYKQVMLSRQKGFNPSPNNSIDNSSGSPSTQISSSQNINRRPGSALSTNSSLYSSTSSIQSVIHVPSAAGNANRQTPPRQLVIARQGSLDSNASTDSLGLTMSPRTPQSPNRPLMNGGIRSPLASPRDHTKDGERKIVGQRVFQSSPC